MPAETCIFVAFGDSEWTQKGACLFLTFRKIVFAYFSKKCHSNRKDHFSSQPPQKHNFLLFFIKIFSHFFSFVLSNIKGQKQKLFLTPQQPAKTKFAPLFVIFKMPPKHYTIGGGGKTSKKSCTDFRLNLGQIFDAKKAKSWTDFWLYSPYICMYVCMYIYACGRVTRVKNWSKIWGVLC